MSLGLSVANDIANAVLTFYARGAALNQTMQQRPLVGVLKSGQKTFPGGKDYVSEPIKGTYMSDTAGFLQGYSEDDTLSFAQAQNILRAQSPWKEVHAGLIITWTELKKDGITITDDAQTSEHADVALTRLSSLLEDRMEDFGESYSRQFNLMCWQDGTQDAKQMPGILSIFPDVTTTGTTEGLDRVTYSFWRHRVGLQIGVSEANQTLSKFLRRELIQLQRFGGRPTKALVGSDFLDALFVEIQAKGIYTQEGFAKNLDMGMGEGSIQMKGLGTFQYDPTLDAIGKSKYCYVFDTRRLKLRPMEGEDNKVLMPDRPYNYMVFLKDMTWTGALLSTQLNANGIYSVA